MYFEQIIVKSTQFGQNWVLFLSKKVYWWVGNWAKNWYRESQIFKVRQVHPRTILVKVTPPPHPCIPTCTFFSYGLEENVGWMDGCLVLSCLIFCMSVGWYGCVVWVGVGWGWGVCEFSFKSPVLIYKYRALFGQFCLYYICFFSYLYLPQNVVP